MLNQNTQYHRVLVVIPRVWECFYSMGNCSIGEHVPVPFLFFFTLSVVQSPSCSAGFHTVLERYSSFYNGERYRDHSRGAPARTFNSFCGRWDHFGWLYLPHKPLRTCCAVSMASHICWMKMKRFRQVDYAENKKHGRETTAGKHNTDISYLHRLFRKIMDSAEKLYGEYFSI